MGDEHIHVHVHADERFRFDLYKLEETLMATLAELQEEVRQTKEASASIIALVKGLAQQIRDNANDPVALTEMAAELDGIQADIAAAVVEGTAPTPEPTPE